MRWPPPPPRYGARPVALLFRPRRANHTGARRGLSGGAICGWFAGPGMGVQQQQRQSHAAGEMAPRRWDPHSSPWPAGQAQPRSRRRGALPARDRKGRRSSPPASSSPCPWSDLPLSLLLRRASRRDTHFTWCVLRNDVVAVGSRETIVARPPAASSAAQSSHLSSRQARPAALVRLAQRKLLVTLPLLAVTIETPIAGSAVFDLPHANRRIQSRAARIGSAFRLARCRADQAKL